jgi:hypothetical protein
MIVELHLNPFREVLVGVLYPRYRGSPVMAQ